MKVNNNLYSLGEAAKMVGVSEETLKNWCLWWEHEPNPPEHLPFADIKYIGLKRERMFDEMDILNLIHFRDIMIQSRNGKVGVSARWNGRNKGDEPYNNNNRKENQND